MNPHHFLTTCIWNVLSENANQMKPSFNSTQQCSNRVFLLEQQRNYRDGKNLTRIQWRGPTTCMEGHAQKCVERYCELGNKTAEQLYKISHPCSDDHQLKKEELESVGDVSEVCSQIVLTCLYLARIGRLDILWSVNKLAKSVTKMDSSMCSTTSKVDFIYSSHK